MKGFYWMHHVFIRNVLGFIALSIIHYISDRTSFSHREGFYKYSPYLFLLLMYAWMIFHNRVLFERFYRAGQKKNYSFWAATGMVLCSLNMHVILRYIFHVNDTLPQILSFWVYTVTGLGVYVIYQYLHLLQPETANTTAAFESVAPPISDFQFSADGRNHKLPLQSIICIESLENYIKVHTSEKSYVVRLSMKEAEEKLPAPGFIRISRSHIINTAHAVQLEGEMIRIKDRVLKIGKVYKRYVEERFK